MRGQDGMFLHPDQIGLLTSFFVVRFGLLDAMTKGLWADQLRKRRIASCLER